MASNATVSAVSAEYLAESKVVDLWVAYSVPIPLEILSTGLRLWAELYAHRHGLAFDDYLMITATIFGVALCASGLGLAVPNGMGRHVETVTPEGFRMVGMGQYVMSHMYQMAMALTKLSVLALYYRAFNSKIFHRFVFATAAVVILWLMNIEILLFWVCQPISIFWSNVDGFCYDMCAFTLYNNIFNLCMDLWILSLPLPIIFQMRVSTKRKILLASLFSIGVATCGVSAARIPFNHIEYTGHPNNLFNVGTTWWHSLRQHPDHLQAARNGNLQNPGLVDGNHGGSRSASGEPELGSLQTGGST
ncbi:hypothetical protein BDV06DRAFT_219771 [Aspergillus oleicola]